MDLAVGEHRDPDRERPRADHDVRPGDHQEATPTSTTTEWVQRPPGDPNPDNDRDTTVVPVDHPNLVVEKDDGLDRGHARRRAHYTVDVHNAGPGDAHGVVVFRELPGELEYVGGSEGVAYAEPERNEALAFVLTADEEPDSSPW